MRVQFAISFTKKTPEDSLRRGHNEYGRRGLPCLAYGYPPKLVNVILFWMHDVIVKAKTANLMCIATGMTEMQCFEIIFGIIAPHPRHYYFTIYNLEGPHSSIWNKI